MMIQLAPSWILTTDHSASSYGIPVPVNRHTQNAYGSGDIVEPYPSWGMMPALQAVHRMIRISKPDLDADKRKLIDRFGPAIPSDADREDWENRLKDDLAE